MAFNEKNKADSEIEKCADLMCDLCLVLGRFKSLRCMDCKVLEFLDDENNIESLKTVYNFFSKGSGEENDI